MGGIANFAKAKQALIDYQNVLKFHHIAQMYNKMFMFSWKKTKQ